MHVVDLKFLIDSKLTSFRLFEIDNAITVWTSLSCSHEHATSVSTCSCDAMKEKDTNTYTHILPPNYTSCQTNEFWRGEYCVQTNTHYVRIRMKETKIVHTVEMYAMLCMWLDGRWNADWHFAPKQRICHSIVRCSMWICNILATILLCVAHISGSQPFHSQFFFSW